MSSDYAKLVIRRALVDPDFEQRLFASPTTVFRDYGLTGNDRTLLANLSPDRLQSLAVELGVLQPDTREMAPDVSMALKEWLDTQDDPLQPLRLAGAMIGGGEPPSTYEPLLEHFWGDLARSEVPISDADIYSLVQWVMREAYLENTKELADYASRVKHYNESKKKVREEIARLRSTFAELEDAVQLTLTELQEAAQKNAQLANMFPSILSAAHQTAKTTIQNMKK